MRYLAGLLIIIFLSQCTSNKDEAKGEIIARAFDNYLYEEDLEGLIPEGSSPQDSILAINRFIKNWVKEQLLINRAEKNLPEEYKDFDKQLTDYRNSLLIYTYEQELIRQNPDTIVTEAEILNYYNENPGQFQLKDNIVKVRYIKLRNNAPQIPKVINWLSTKSEEEKVQLEEYALRHAVNFYFDDNSWLLFNDVLKEIPIKTYNQEAYLQNHRNIEIRDSLYVYLVSIQGFRISETLSPLGFERERIRSILINRKKNELISKMEEETMREGTEKGYYEIVNP